MTNESSITVQAPATTANMGPGFDSMGMALKLYNRFTFTPSETDSFRFSDKTSVDTTSIPTTVDPKKSKLFHALDHFFKHIDPQHQQEHPQRQQRPRFSVVSETHIPTIGGLGSSATAITSALIAANHFAKTNFSLAKLVQLATEVEGHPDNVAPALLGNIQVTQDNKGNPALLNIQVSPEASQQNGTQTLRWPNEWKITLAMPAQEVRTADARRAMPDDYSNDTRLEAKKNFKQMITSLREQNAEPFRQVIEQDVLHEPYRSPLIKDFELVKEHAKKAGALGTVISGSGATLAVFSENSTSQAEIKKALQALETKHKLTLLDVEPETQGARIINAVAEIKQ